VFRYVTRVKHTRTFATLIHRSGPDQQGVARDLDRQDPSPHRQPRAVVERGVRRGRQDARGGASWCPRAPAGVRDCGGLDVHGCMCVMHRVFQPAATATGREHRVNLPLASEPLDNHQMTLDHITVFLCYHSHSTG
jgi:hypothetical protein